MSKIVVEMERACLQECDELRTELAEAGAEITALRAALDQEREKVERLQFAAGDAIHYLEKARIWSGMGWHWNHLRKDLAEKVHAMLSGRGEGGNDG